MWVDFTNCDGVGGVEGLAKLLNFIGVVLVEDEGYIEVACDGCCMEVECVIGEGVWEDEEVGG